jgi:hypothetical protein
MKIIFIICRSNKYIMSKYTVWVEQNIILREKGKLFIVTVISGSILRIL